MISAFFLVKDESEFVGASIQSLLDVEPKLVKQVIVLDQKSSDNSMEEILNAFKECEFTNFTYIYFNQDDFSTKGEIFFRELGLQLSTQPWVLHVDSDACLSTNWSKLALEPMSNPEVGCIYATYVEHIGSRGYYKPNTEPEGRGVIYRKHPNLHYVGGYKDHWETHCSWHGQHIGEKVFLRELLYFHFSYTKKDLVLKLENNAKRGDYTRDLKEIANYVAERRTEKDVIWKNLAFRLGEYLFPVDYNQSLLPRKILQKPVHELTFTEEGFLCGRVLKT